MATANEQPPSLRCESPSPEASPTRALGACPELSRCVSTASSWSHGSGTDVSSRESLGSDTSSFRHSTSSYHSRRSDMSAVARQSTCTLDGRGRRRSPRRGYMRPQPTDFAQSAKSRESVMSLGSIAHLQYYFARTGLLDGKGGQLARKKHNRVTLDLSELESTSLAPKIISTDADSSYASMGSSPDFTGDGFANSGLVESPLEELDDDFYDDFLEEDPDMLPPTVSTYHQKEKHIPRPPTILELKVDVENALAQASKALREVSERKAGTYKEPPNAPKLTNMPEENSQAWYELQGMNVLDVTTLAIRAAKMFYTAHELPDRLDAIKPEKQVRADLLEVMEVLKQMATRNFQGGLKDDEIQIIGGWIESVQDILKKEQAIEDAEQAERDSWTWVKGDWTGREMERERQFLLSMDTEAEPLPEWTPVSDAAELPTPFLEAMANGIRLVNLHNAAVHKSRRRFGNIPTFHTNTQKPYRSADNLRYWAKAAELRFEVMVNIDALGIVYNTGPQVWIDFEAAILKWCRHVREGLASDLIRRRSCF